MAKLPDLTRVNGFSYGKGELVLSPNSPMDSARRLLSDRYTTNDEQVLYRHRGDFYCWQQNLYAEVTSDYLHADINLFLECAKKAVKVKDENGERTELVAFHPKRSNVNEVYGAMESIAYLGDPLQPPFWLDDNVPDLPASEILSCENGLLHLPTRALLPHTTSFFTHNAIDYSFDITATEPTEWLKFLTQLWPDDQESIDALQEIFGYCLVADTSQQKAFMLIGPKRSGKGTIARILEATIGVNNVVAPTLTGLSTNFGMQPLIGKRLAIISDARISGKADTAIIAERILAVTGEDAITLDRKNRDAWTGKLDIKFLLISNELPRIADASGALASRFVVITMSESFFGREDRGLTMRLLRERPGILLWAIQGYERLCERGYFLQPDSANDAVRVLEDLGSPISAFLREACTIGPKQLAPVSELYDAWSKWCGEQGRGLVTNAQTFGKDLRAVLPGIKVVQPREFNQRRCYSGVSLQPSDTTPSDPYASRYPD